MENKNKIISVGDKLVDKVTGETWTCIRGGGEPFFRKTVPVTNSNPGEYLKVDNAKDIMAKYSIKKK